VLDEVVARVVPQIDVRRALERSRAGPPCLTHGRLFLFTLASSDVTCHVTLRVGVMHAMEGSISRFGRAVCDYFTLGSAAGANCAKI
jgi:hypothetical protein